MDNTKIAIKGETVAKKKGLWIKKKEKKKFSGLKIKTKSTETQKLEIF